MPVIQMRNGVILICLLACTLNTAAAATTTCQNTVTFNNQTFTYSLCTPLALGASIAWNYSADGLLSMHFENAPEVANGWVAWGISHNGKMPHSSALLCYPGAGGEGVIVLQYILGEYFVTPTEPGGVLNVSKVGCEIVDNGNLYKLQVVIQLAPNPDVYHLWGRGPRADPVSGFLSPHGPTNNFGAAINFLTGQAGKPTSSHRFTKNTHGVLNAVSWGFLVPLGAFFPRYVRPFAPVLWYYCHMPMQLTGYILGVVGFAYGMRLMSWDVERRLTHRHIGIVIFVFATLQVLALVFRPKKDAKIRFYWNVYHHSSGYLVIVLGIVNCFYGFHVLEHFGIWRKVYIIVLVCLGALAVALEALTWFYYFARHRPVDSGESLKPHQQKQKLTSSEAGNAQEQA